MTGPIQFLDADGRTPRRVTEADPLPVTATGDDGGPVPVVLSNAVITELMPHPVSGEVVIPVGESWESPWVDVLQYAGLTFNTSSTGVILGRAQYSHDGSDPFDHEMSTPFAGAGAFSIDRQARYLKVQVDNLSAAPVTFFLEVIGNAVAQQPFFFPIGAPIDPSFAATLTKGVITAQTPGGPFTNLRADGLAVDRSDVPVTTSTPLGAAGIYESDWIDTDGWAGAELWVGTDQISGSLGIEIEFTDDVAAAVPEVLGERRYTFTAQDVANGFANFKFSTELDGMRIRYTNGGVAQGVFFLALTMRVEGVLPQSSIVAQLNASNIALMVRGILNAVNDAGTYDNISRSDLGGLRIAVREHEVLTPIKNLTKISGLAAAIASATKIVDSATLPAGTRTITIQAAAANNQILFFSTVELQATSGAALFELDKGQMIVIEVGEGLENDIWAAPASGSQRYRVMYLGEAAL